MIKRNLFVLALVVYNLTTFAQNSNSHLLFQYFGVNDNQCEIIYISQYLEKYNYTMPGADQDKAIEEAHKYYLTHKEDIDIAIKANELIEFRSIVKERKAAMWSQALSSIASSLATGVAAGNAAAMEQQQEYQKKINRDKDIQAYIAQHSSNTPKQYTQEFGDMPTRPNDPQSPRVTTSNGFEEPLPSAKSFKAGTESEVMGVKVDNGIRQSVRLRVNGDRLEDIWVGDPFVYNGNKSWYPVGQNGYPTDYKADGELSKLYKYKAMVRIAGSGLITVYY